MSKIRVNFDVVLDESDAIDLLNHVESMKNKAYDTTDMLDTSRMCRIYKTFHDEKPVKPCSHSYHVDFSGTKKTHKVEDLKTLLDLNDKGLPRSL